MQQAHSKAVISQLDQLCREKLLKDTPLLIIVGETIKNIPDLARIYEQKRHTTALQLRADVAGCRNLTKKTQTA